MDHIPFDKRKMMLCEWRKTETFRNLIQQYQVECDRLLAQGFLYLQDLGYIRKDAARQTVTVQYATKGSTHRGVYCPSPVVDLFIGNISRGRRLKRITAKSNPSHCFGIDTHDQLVYAETFLLSQDFPSYTEYLLREHDKIVGITVDANDQLLAVSEEIYHCSKIQAYTYAQLSPLLGEKFCLDFYKEEYSYDSQGLAVCARTLYDPPSQNLREKTLCAFHRKDGFLHSYTVLDQIWAQIDPEYTQAMEYIVRIPRKA